MSRVTRILIAFLLCIPWAVLFGTSFAQDPSSGKWQIASIKLCRTNRGEMHPHIEVYGRFPVYSFFVPRPVWTVNGAVVEAQPAYERGALTSFTLLYASHLLTGDNKNTIKFSLPDQNGARVFRYDTRRPRPGECYEFF
ncbi:MAG: hypothetical protein V2B18_26095 [Pseudomonadota bacterium]